MPIRFAKDAAAAVRFGDGDVHMAAFARKDGAGSVEFVEGPAGEVGRQSEWVDFADTTSVKVEMFFSTVEALDVVVEMLAALRAEMVREAERLAKIAAAQRGTES